MVSPCDEKKKDDEKKKGGNFIAKCIATTVISIHVYISRQTIISLLALKQEENPYFAYPFPSMQHQWWIPSEAYKSILDLKNEHTPLVGHTKNKAARRFALSMSLPKRSTTHAYQVLLNVALKYFGLPQNLRGI